MATRTIEQTKNLKDDSMSAVDVGLEKDIVTVVEEPVSLPVPERKSGFFARMGDRIMNYIENLAYPPMSVRDRLDSDDLWEEYYRYYYPLW